MNDTFDRELLLGLIAVEQSLITPEQLAAALRACAASGDGAPNGMLRLAQQLVAQQALRAEELPPLEQLVAHRLAEHGGQAMACVAEIAVSTDQLEALQAISDPEARALVTTLRPSPPTKSTKAPSPVIVSGSRFRVLRPHAKGGLGEVYVAQDEELNREVALKEIQSQYQNDAESRARFVLEAEITGGLEHPGIVPVYGLGHYPDGRPYYAMRFIQGDSLHEAIKRFHAQDAQGIATTDRILELRQLLKRFVDVCQAIAYAHSRGVLHRDLKPGNIMLGKYGETLVVDWGLAKVRGRDERTAATGEQTLRPSSGSDVAATRFGSAIGTPAYMPPEQAAGELSRLGPASDVYSLGATLYHLLTGAPPFQSNDLTTLLESVRSGKFPRPRAVRPETPAALESICLKAMAREPADRYETTQFLADDVERFLAGEPVSAHPESRWVRARRWARKHPALTSVSLAVILLTALGLGVISAILNDKNQQLTNLNGKLDRQNTELTQAIAKAKAAEQLAETNAAQAREQSQLALASLGTFVSEMPSEFRDTYGSSARRKMLADALEQLDQVATQYVGQGEIDHHMVRALAELGDGVLAFGLGPDLDGLLDTAGLLEGRAPLTAEKQTASAVATKLVQRAVELARQAVALAPDNLQAQLDLAYVLNRWGRIEGQTGRKEAAREAYDESCRLFRQLAAALPADEEADRDLTLALDALGAACLELGDANAALAACQEAVALARSSAAEGPESQHARFDLPLCLDGLGAVYEQQGAYASAADTLAESAELRTDLADAAPDDFDLQRKAASTWTRLARVIRRAGRYADWQRASERSLQIAARLASPQPTAGAVRDEADAQFNVALGHIDLEQWAAARDLLDKALASYNQLAAESSNDLSARVAAVRCRERLSSIATSTGDASAALAELEGCVREVRELLADAPNDLQSLDLLGSALESLGDARQAQKDPAGAAQVFEESVEVRQRLADRMPGDSSRQMVLALVLDKLGGSSLQQGDLPAALQKYAASLQIRQQILESAPQDFMVVRDLGVSYQHIGNVHMQQGAIEEALHDFQRSHQVFESVADQTPPVPRWQRVSAYMQMRIGDACYELNALTEARQAYEAALGPLEHFAALAPSDAVVQSEVAYCACQLGRTFYLLGEMPEAIAVLERAAHRYREMIAAGLEVQTARGLEVQTSEQALQQLLEYIDSAKGFELAYGDWETLLAQPAEALPALLETRAIHRMRSAQFVEAAQAARALAAAEFATPRELYNSACIFALSAASIQPTEDSPLTPEQLQQRQAWIDESLAALRAALAAGFNSFELLARDTDLDALRDQPEFKAILRELPVDLPPAIAPDDAVETPTEE